MFSTSTAPVMTFANARPMTVMSEVIAARSTWPKTTVRSGQALRPRGAARSRCSITSSTAERV